MISYPSHLSSYRSLTGAIDPNQESPDLKGQHAESAMHTYRDEIGAHGNMKSTAAADLPFFTPVHEDPASDPIITIPTGVTRTEETKWLD